MRQINLIFVLTIFTLACYLNLYAQMQGLHGDILEQRNGVHAGNQFRVSLYNDGMLGGNVVPPDYFGEWPINSGRQYLRDGNIFVGSEVLDREGVLKHIMSTNPRNRAANDPSAGDTGPNGENWTFLPLRGFANPDTNKLAMSKWKFSWPYFWPDKADDPVDPGWAGSWNGYFGKNVFNADEESYYVADDYANQEFNFYPDKLDSNRRGLGIRLYFRGFQWSNALVEDALFILYDLENIGTHEHDKMVFGYKIGNNLGDTETASGDGSDDNGEYDKEIDVAFLFDNDDIGAGGWTPVGFIGGAFLESPGNHFDGIDNDNDGINGSGLIITESMMNSEILHAGDEIIITDYITFEREKIQMPNDTIRVFYQDLVFKFWPGKEIAEIPFNLVDDNLNGIIDESNGATFGTPPDEITTYLYVGLKCKDYFTGEGLDNTLLDERRDDEIDNDGDWDIRTDDLGADGVAFTGDPGEGDGRPTSGEPHFDKTDIDETDMLGLTSFTLYYWPDIPRYQDELVWDAIRPGYFDELLQNDNTELLYGSGYFPMKPGQIERFSMGIILGEDRDDFYENAYWVAKAYNENYNFSKAPNIPTLRAVPGDKRVVLTWDDFAEESVDPITGKDFEGYRIYRSTDPGWNDMKAITDGQGSVTYRKPIAQFDLDNEHSGYAPSYIKGIHFWLGQNTGIKHVYVDTTVQNGYTYYYAVTSYDHGDPAANIPPSECSKYVSISSTGQTDIGTNVAIVRPEAPAAGLVQADFDSSKIKKLPGTLASGAVNYKIVDPLSIKDNNTYQIFFEDSLSDLLPVTKNFTLVNVTSGEILLDKSTLFNDGDELPLTEGFQIYFQGNPAAFAMDEANSGWNRPGVYAARLAEFSYRDQPVELLAADFKVVMGEIGIDTSVTYFRGTTEIPSVPVNFTVINLNTNKKVKFALREQDTLPGEEGKFTAFTDGRRTDEIILLSGTSTDTIKAGWQISLANVAPDTLPPDVGDELLITFQKPFTSTDSYEFTTYGQKLDKKLAATQLDNIKVVPNPYVVVNSWEPLNPYSNGRGPRELHFTHLPPKCTIRIFNIRGQLMTTLMHDSELWDGTEVWNMVTKDEMDIAYGIYVYHVSAEGIGEKIGKFAVVK
ncbi:hypothetical protein JW935_04370 [candidate division KSB1 bacterium]|nr:hypothetical protein [candidate division KSB1 bacterium]